LRQKKSFLACLAKEKLQQWNRTAKNGLSNTEPAKKTAQGNHKGSPKKPERGPAGKLQKTGVRRHQEKTTRRRKRKNELWQNSKRVGKNPTEDPNNAN